MQKLFQELIASLGEELRLCAELRTLLDQEREPIKRFKAEALEEITQRKQAVQSRLAKEERRRRQAAADLATLFGLDPEKVTLRELADRADQRQRATLLRARSVFSRLAEEIGIKTAQNAARIDRSLWLVRSLRRIMSDEIEEAATYERLGRAPRANAVRGK
jgi:flagellar biosynthesis/type III secretory pathway chaperone